MLSKIRLFAALALLGAAFAPVDARAAGGAFAVDDAEIGNPGDCAVNSWTSFASNHDFAGVVSPICVVKLGIPVELSGQIQRNRSGGAWGTAGLVQGKANLIPIAHHPFGLGLSGGATWDLISGANTGGYFNVPATFQVREDLRVNLNAGWLYDNTARIGYLTWGGGFEWNLAKLVPAPLTLIGEIYGQSGRLAAADIGDPPSPNSVREPRSQLGLRLTPKDNIDIDAIWGRNITGENAHWLTLGVNLRF